MEVLQVEVEVVEIMWIEMCDLVDLRRRSPVVFPSAAH